jgi:hypothetical protein
VLLQSCCSCPTPAPPRSSCSPRLACSTLPGRAPPKSSPSLLLLLALQPLPTPPARPRSAVRHQALRRPVLAPLVVVAVPKPLPAPLGCSSRPTNLLDAFLTARPCAGRPCAGQNVSIMGCCGPIRIGPSIQLFFLFLFWILGGYASTECRIRIRIRYLSNAYPRLW